MSQGISQDVLNSLVKTQITMLFAAPAALNEDVVGTEKTIGISSFNLLTPNVITNIQNELDPAVGLTYTLYTKRLNDVRKQLGVTANFLTSFTGEIRPNFPIGLAAGFFQFAEQQNAGALTAQNYLITTIQPLVI